MTHPLLQEHKAIIARKDEIESQMLEFGKIQHQLMIEAAEAAGFESSCSDYDHLRRADWYNVGEYGEIECWVRGCWGGEDWMAGSFMLDPLILDGKNEEFKEKQIQFFKDEKIRLEAEKIEKARKELERTRESLMKQQEELAKKLAELGDRS